MVRTRRGKKRSSPRPEESEGSDFEGKKAKIKNESVSKYFTSSFEEQGLDNKGDLTVHSSKTNTCIIKEPKSLLNLENESDDESIVLKKPRATLKLKNESDDESSSDEFMKVPFSLDDLGEFETLKKDSVSLHLTKENKLLSNIETSKLSEGSSDDKEIDQQDYYDFSQIIQSQELLLNTKKELEKKEIYKKETDLSHTKNKQNKRNSTKVKNDKLTNKPLNEDLGISELLAIAEGPIVSQNLDDQYSEDNEVEESYSVPEGGVQVTIELPNVNQMKRKSKGFDVEAAMKRRLNLIRKENQVFMHKVHTLCWIAHGINLNRIINNDDLMGIALSLIPSKHCYPSKHADLNYLEKLVEWFIGKVDVDEGHQLALNGSSQPLMDILQIEIKLKKAFSKRDLVLIFVCMVRSLGIDARLVISFRSVPLRPPASDLYTISNTISAESKNGTKPKKSVETSKIDKKVSMKPRKQSSNSTQSIGLSNVTLNLDKDKKIHTNSKVINSPKKTSKGKRNVANKQNCAVTSPYFSSSDEVSLKELQRRCNSSNKCSTSKIDKSPTKEIESPISKILPNTSKSKSSKIKNNLPPLAQNKCIKDSENELSISPTSLKDSARRPKRASHSLVINNENHNQKKEILERQTRTLKNRKSDSLSYQELNTTSEDEIEIPSQIQKKRNTSRKLNKSNSSDRNTNPRNKKNENGDSNFHTKKDLSKRKSIDRRVLSSDDENNESSKKIGNDFWAEVYLEAEEKWITVDLIKGKVHCIHQLYNRATQPVRYVIAFNNDGSAKDVTRRYAPQWLTVTRRLRVDDKWWQETIAPYKPQRTRRDKDEDEDLDRQLHDKPLPTSVSEYKNHPLYALRRHLLKFEAIYPPDAPPLGFVRGEPVYSRGCVADLHTREAWIKEAKLVRRGEEPYKIVKARPKWDKVSQKVINDLPLPLFGHWQVEDYIPPPAVDGKVPRNEYGNVELYKPCMLPAGTVHLQVPQLARVARKLGIDCAPAVVGWEFSGGSSHPVLDGFIVCEEVKEVLLDAWNKEMDESAKRAKEKVEQRVYGNWKRLIKGLLIRERLKRRYDFGVPEPTKKKQQSKPGTSKT